MESRHLPHNQFPGHGPSLNDSYVQGIHSSKWDYSLDEHFKESHLACFLVSSSETCLVNPIIYFLKALVAPRQQKDNLPFINKRLLFASLTLQNRHNNNNNRHIQRLGIFHSPFSKSPRYSSCLSEQQHRPLSIFRRIIINVEDSDERSFINCY